MATSQEDLDSRRIFATLKKVVSDLVQHFNCDDEAMKIEFQVDSAPFEISFKFSVHPVSQLLTLYSKLNFTVAEEYREAYCRAICELNYDRMYAATFDFSPEKGVTVFRVPVLYRKSILSPELLEGVARYTFDTVNKYTPSLYDISHGVEASLPEE
ncbi:MAG: hypothetical protein J6Y20_15255 [Lachnospiraceae bacterium]|nr:hypothetical protein [Lachnospiraceae bacterium]